jgi:hypothetical protein
MKNLRDLLLIGLFLLPIGCRSSSEPWRQVPTPEGALNFAIQPTRAAKGVAQLWDCSYSSRGRTAKFQLELEAAPSSDRSEPLPIAFGKGAFLAVPGSDASSLIQDLRKPLQANAPPLAMHRVPKLAFTYASFGDHMSQATDGGFAANPPGKWAAYKLFVGTTSGGEPAEVFLNVDAADGVGQFSIKDPDYGQTLLSYFNSVL